MCGDFADTTYLLGINAVSSAFVLPHEDIAEDQPTKLLDRAGSGRVAVYYFSRRNW